MATPQHLLPLQQRVIDLLHNHSVQRINFTLAPHTVTGAGFRQVAYALGGGIIDVALDPKLPPDAGAQYASGQLVFRAPNTGVTLLEQMYIVHECTHALNDMRGSHVGVATFAQNEAAAYVAGALFVSYEMERYSVSALAELRGEKYLTNASTLPGQYAQAALTAEQIKNFPGKFVEIDQAISLMEGVVASPVYQKMGVTMATPMTYSGRWKR